MKVPLFYVACVASAVTAFIVAAIGGFLLSFANITVIVSAIVGEEGAAALLSLLGNILYSAIFAYGCVASFTTIFKRQHSDAEIPMLLVGFVTSLAMTFGFASFAASYTPAVALWLAEQDQIVGIAAIMLISVAVVGSAVAGTGVLIGNGRGDSARAAS